MKRLMKRALRACGYEVRRVNLRAHPAHQLVTALNRFRVELVFDIGANKGQFARDLRCAGFEGEIVSFEPLREAHRELVSAASRDLKWRVHPRVLVGDRNGEASINVAGNSVSSSVLPMEELHASVAQGSAYVGTELVPMVTLDAVAPLYLTGGRRYFLKIDTQGFEWQVLDGSKSLLAGACGVFCEVSLVPLYEGQRLWKEVIARLEEDGFSVWLLRRGFTDPNSGRSLQIDVGFFRANCL